MCDVWTGSSTSKISQTRRKVQIVYPATLSALKWDLDLGSGVVASTTTLSSAILQKTLTCSANRCVLYGLNVSTIPDGVVAIVNVSLAPTAYGVISTNLTNVVGATSDGSAIPFTTTAGTITIVPVINVSVTPATASLYASKTQLFNAAVSGGPGKTSVTWSLSPSLGSIDTAGLYTAPASVAAQQTVTVTATSVADPAKGLRQPHRDGAG